MASVTANRPERIALLDSAPTEMQAGVIVAALEQEGIKSTMTGMHTAGFRAEAPGWVKILVAEDDLLRAQTALRQVVLNNMDIDWSHVDVGKPTQDEPGDESTNGLTSLTFWRRVAYVLIVVYLTLLAAGVINDVIGILLRLAG